MLLPLAVPQIVDATPGPIASPADSMAVDGPPSKDPNTADRLDVIIVTAQRRSEDIKDIPTSISVISGAQLADHHILNYDDITRTVPGVSFQAGPAPGLDNISIRGVSSYSATPTVGVYIDDVSLSVRNVWDNASAGTVLPKLFDVDRIEILRGPQGTLYGASNMGGTIRFITKQPEMDELNASGSTDLSVTRHGGFNHDETAILNWAILPGVFALRVGADISHESGYIDHFIPTTNGYANGTSPDGGLLTLETNDSTGVIGRKGVNDDTTDVIRIAGKYLGSDALTVLPSFLWQRRDIGDTSVFYPSIGQYAQDKHVAEPGRDSLVLSSITVTKGFDSAVLTSVTSYSWRDYPRMTDGTFFNSNIFAQSLADTNPPNSPLNGPTLGIIGFLPSPVSLDTTTNQYTQELRLQSNLPTIAGIPVTWVTGLYYSYTRTSHSDNEYIPALNADFQQIYGYNIFYSPFGGSALPGVSYDGDAVYHEHLHEIDRQSAIFGELGVNLTPQLKASIGLRYVYALQAFAFESTGYFGFGIPSPYAVESKSTAVTPKYSLDYAIDDSKNVYATVAKGFRLGGPTGPDPANVPGGICNEDYADLGVSGAPLTYASDSLWSYEVGTKGRYLDNRLSVNAGLYFINWSNIQQTVTLPICGLGYTANAGNARSLGSELEIRAVVASGLTLDLAAGNANAYITRSLYPGIFGVGEKILNVPNFTATLGADYEWALGANTKGFIYADVPYTGRSHAYYDSSTVTNHWDPSYAIANLNIGITRGNLKLGLYATNLLDNKKIIQYPSVDSVQEGFTVRPRTIGVTAAWRE